MQISDQTIPQVYSDGVTINVSHSTITIMFMLSEPWQEPPVNRTVARIQMSPIQFKLLNRVMPQLLSEYEAHFGEISTKGIEIGIVPQLSNESQEGGQ